VSPEVDSHCHARSLSNKLPALYVFHLCVTKKVIWNVKSVSNELPTHGLMEALLPLDDEA